MDVRCKDNCLSKKYKMHPFDNRLTYDDVYFKNFDRKRKLEEMGVKCELVFGCDAKRESKGCKLLRNFMKSPTSGDGDTSQPNFDEYDIYAITPRAALRGGRVETVNPCLELSDEEIARGQKRITHYDAVSMYPYHQKKQPFPIGHVTKILTSHDLPNRGVRLSLADINQYEGIFRYAAFIISSYHC